MTRLVRAALAAIALVLCLPAAAGAASGWIDGVAANTFAIHPVTGYGPQTLSWIGYWGANDASSPRVGDVFYVHMVSGVIGVGDAPALNLGFDGTLAPDVDFMISPQNPVHCYYYSPGGGYTDFTNDASKCAQTPQPGFVGGTYFFGGLALPPGASWEVQVPIRVRRPKSGIASGTAARIYNAQTTAIGAPSPLITHQDIFVAPRVPEFGPATTAQITANGARTSSDVFTFWKAGQAFFDLGTTAGTYPYTSIALALPDNDIGFNVFTDWSGLNPSQVYHWRLRVVVDGQTYLGPDQTFTTIAGAAPPGGGPTGSGGGSGTPPPPPPGDPGGGAPAPDTISPTATVARPACRAGEAAAACARRRASVAAWRRLTGTVADAAPSSGIAAVEVAAVLKTGTRCRRATATGFAKVKCSATLRWLPATVTAGTWKLTLKGLGKGRLTVHVRARDVAGNVSAPGSRSVTLRR
jgi:hypothetical protein